MPWCTACCHSGSIVSGLSQRPWAFASTMTRWRARNAACVSPSTDTHATDPYEPGEPAHLVGRSYVRHIVELLRQVAEAR